MKKSRSKPKAVPVAQSKAPLPTRNTTTEEIFGFFTGQGSITGDVVAPSLSREEWGELG
jgi:hypothetical protein